MPMHFPAPLARRHNKLMTIIRKEKKEDKMKPNFMKIKIRNKIHSKEEEQQSFSHRYHLMKAMTNDFTPTQIRTRVKCELAHAWESFVTRSY